MSSRQHAQRTLQVISMHASRYRGRQAGRQGTSLAVPVEKAGITQTHERMDRQTDTNREKDRQTDRQEQHLIVSAQACAIEVSRFHAHG